MTTIKTTAYRTLREAHTAADPFNGRWAITVDGHNVVLPVEAINKLGRAGKSFAWITLCRGRYMTVPVN